MIITVIAFLFVLGVLVIVHELGHLLAAKKLGIKIETFSVGFGPRITGIRRGDTDYILSLIPLGGFVKLSQEPPKKEFYPNSPHFFERPPLDKIIVALSGPLMNFFFALIILSCIYVIGVKVPIFMDKPPAVGWVNPDSLAQHAGLHIGDEITAVNEIPIYTWEELMNTIPLYANKPIELKLIRGQQSITKTLLVGSQGETGFFPAEIVKIGNVKKSSPAEVAGLQAGDIIKTVNLQPILTWNQFLYILSKEDTKTLLLDVVRGEKILSIKVKPEVDRNANRKYIGISYQPEEKIKRYSLFSAIKQGLLKTKEIITLSLKILWKLITLDLSIKTLGGPVLIAQVSGESAKSGLIPLLSFLAFLSIQLGLFNLLPFIPIVDGGQISFYLFEMIRKRPISIVTFERISKAGWAAMIVLILIVTYNDIIRIL
jgi:regulator of sigma E protease